MTVLYVLLVQEGAVKLLTGRPTNVSVLRTPQSGMKNVANVEMEAFTRESWNLLRGHARRKKQGGDIVLLLNQTTFVESLRLSMAVMRRNFSSIGPRGLGGLAVERMRG